jgi:serine/threonine protein kinase
VELCAAWSVCIKIVDFGRAVLAGEKLSFLLGSPMYMAPETHRREAGGIRTDLYSLGLVGLEMLCGERLTEIQNVAEEDLLDLKASLPDNLSGMLPKHVRRNKALVNVLRGLLAPNPEDRYDSATSAEIGDDGLKVCECSSLKQESTLSLPGSSRITFSN